MHGSKTTRRKAPRASGFEEQVSAISELGDATRRALYLFVAAQHTPVSREQAAVAVGVASHTAKFHLDKLAASGLLDTDYSRPEGRSGPGAGRPAKRYRRSAREVTVSLPARSYELAGRILARAIEAASRTGVPVTQTLHASAAAEGHELGRRARSRVGEAAGPAAQMHGITEVLSEHGYEPHSDGEAITLTNCPFHTLAREYPDLVCNMNLDLVRALVEGCDAPGMDVELHPAQGRCCITLQPCGATAE